MFCSKKKFAPKSIPRELNNPLSFSINETSFQMRNFEGIKSNTKNLNSDYDKIQNRIKDKIDLMEELNTQSKKLSDRIRTVEGASKQVEKDTLIDLIAMELKKSVLIDECLKYEQLAADKL